jgi:aminomethyltransferase
MQVVKTTAFHDINLRHGAQMRELFGYWLPWEYAPGHHEEHLATRQRASLCDLDYMGEYTIEGPDALRFLQHLFTNDLGRLPVHAIKYSAMCKPDGCMVDDGTVWRLADDRFMYVSGDEGDYEWLVENAAGYDVRLENITAAHTTVALQGPRSHDIMRRIDPAFDEIRYSRFVEASIRGIDCLVASMGYTGESGYEVHFHPDGAEPIWTALMEAGAADAIVPLGQAALESLRQEAGYLLVGNDHDKATNPLEAGIGWTVKFDKGEFTGRDALLEVARTGVRRQIVWLTLRDGAAPAKGDPILSFGRRIGTVTSGSYSPTFRNGTGMGYVDPGFAIPGIDVSVETDGVRHDANLSVMPRYDPGDWLTKSRR